jgi:hypothetical protein
MNIENDRTSEQQISRKQEKAPTSGDPKFRF